MTDNQQMLYPIVQALVFSSDQPLSAQTLFELLQLEYPDIELADVQSVLLEIKQSLAGSGLVLAEIGETVRIQVADDYLDWVYKLYQQNPPKLSRALLETLSIMAHRQPITRSEIEAIRGVSVSSPIMAQLKQQGWIKALGQKDVPGHPTLWGTTPKLLEDLGLSSKQALIDQLETIVQRFIQEQEQAQSQNRIDLDL